jgi:hypothetical protein
MESIDSSDLIWVVQLKNSTRSPEKRERVAIDDWKKIKDNCLGRFFGLASKQKQLQFLQKIQLSAQN